MNQMTKLIFTLSFVFCLYACTETTQNEATKTATYETVSKTVTEQSPAYIRAAPSISKLKMQMDGTWQDANDSKRMFVISGDEYYELYEGRQVAKMKFDIYSACPSEQGAVDENGQYIWLRTAIDTTCYQIADLNASTIVLENVEEGKQLQYERKQ